MLNFHIIIPARLESTRLPRKLLRVIGNKTLLQHTYERALQAGALSVTIATDHPLIADSMTALGANVLLTSDQHQTGSDRLAQSVDMLGFDAETLVVNLQGDEPLAPICLIQQVAANLAKHPNASIATLYEPIHHRAELVNPGVVKVLFTQQGWALYFSRAVIPFDRDHRLVEDQHLSQYYFRHLGLYAYRAGFLRDYQQLQPAPCESLENLEQLRALYYGYAIHLELAKAYCPPGVDTEADLQHFSDYYHNRDSHD